MDFSDNKPIYRQIIDWCHERILSGQWQASQRVPSVRELGTQLSVNSHTALKAYDALQAEDVIVQKRGLGFFLADDAVEKVREARRQEFFNETLPAIFDSMASLGISIDDLIEHYRSYKGQQTEC